jgi:hypothetical protein
LTADRSLRSLLFLAARSIAGRPALPSTSGWG